MEIPTRYWIIAGIGESDVSILDAIDKTYLNAGLGYQNHVRVSSIPPVKEITPKIDSDKGITFVPIDKKWKMIPFSKIIHVVQAQKTGVKGEEISSSISLAKIIIDVEGKNELCLLAYESTGTKLEETEEASIVGVHEMIKQRGALLDDKWEKNGLKTISCNLKIEKAFGCSIVFVVFDPFTYENKEVL